MREEEKDLAGGEEGGNLRGPEEEVEPEGAWEEDPQPKLEKKDIHRIAEGWASEILWRGERVKQSHTQREQSHDAVAIRGAHFV